MIRPEAKVMEKFNKGKGREKDAAVNGSSSASLSQDESGSSIASRVATSASGLAADFFGSSNPNSLTNTLASSEALSGKGQSSGALGGSKGPESSTTFSQPYQNAPVHGYSNFRSNLQRPIGSNEDAEQGFASFLDGTAPQVYEQPDGIDSFYSKNRTPQTYVEEYQSFQLANDSSWSSSAGRTTRTADISNKEDGAEVLALLDHPNFSALVNAAGLEGESAVAATEGPIQDEESDSTEYFRNLGLTGQELATLNRLKRIMPIPETHTKPAADNPLNLIPQKSILSDEKDVNTLVEASADESGQDSLMRDWEGVLNGYTDEVWGDLLPLVQAAKEEIKAEREGWEGTDGGKSAVERLNMILSHLERERVRSM
jgi:hypothetical protein